MKVSIFFLCRLDISVIIIIINKIIIIKIIVFTFQSIIGDFNKKQEEFLRNRHKRKGTCM